MKNQFKIEILEDGTISVETESFDPQVHAQADELVRHLGKLMGGKVEIREKRSHAKQHSHGHDHAHHHHHH